MEAVKIEQATIERVSAIGRNIVHIRDVEIQRREKCVLVGKSGSGKTTLLHTIAGLHSIAAGEVFIQGTSIGKLSEAERDVFRSRHIGLVFQNLQLIPALSVMENILLGAHFSGKKEGAEFRAKELLVLLGIEHKSRSFPNQLSIGEQQRAAVARALINEPALLLIDEPTANLDEENSGKVVQQLLNVAEEAKAALLVVTHDAYVAEMFRDTMHIEDYVRVEEK